MGYWKVLILFTNIRSVKRVCSANVIIAIASLPAQPQLKTKQQFSSFSFSSLFNILFLTQFAFDLKVREHFCKKIHHNAYKITYFLPNAQLFVVE